ncbi:MAG: TetR family transcriptional regulator [Chloroflexota bacterium]|nr:TetR family transcriptional regulator [Chloroflexota bacterium]
MARWAPATAERLQTAAMELFTSRGFDQVTAAQIAEAAGTTERTFFRYFADKRDVLFQRQDALVQAFADGIRSAPASATPMQLVAAAVRSGADTLPDDQQGNARTRHGIIASNPALLERERHKGAAIADGVRQALRERGIDDATAVLAAESTVTIFHLAFTRWLDDDSARPLTDIADEMTLLFAGLASPSRITRSGDDSR